MNLNKDIINLEQIIRKFNFAIKKSDDELSDIYYEYITTLDNVIEYIKSNMIKAILIIGIRDYVDDLIIELTDIYSYYLSKLNDDFLFINKDKDLDSVLILEPTDYVIELINTHHFYNYKLDILDEDQLLDYVFCDKFYTLDEFESDDDNISVGVFSIYFDDNKLSDIQVIKKWFKNIFKNLRN